MCILQLFYLQGWLAQSPVQTFCPSWQSTGRLRHHSSTFPPWWGSPDWARWNEHCCQGRWSLHCDTMTAHTHLIRSRYRTETLCYPHCLLPFEGWPPPSRALETQIREGLFDQMGIHIVFLLMTTRLIVQYILEETGEFSGGICPAWLQRFLLISLDFPLDFMHVYHHYSYYVTVIMWSLYIICTNL